MLLLCLLDTADADGAVPIANLTLAFRDFYLDRLARGLPVERPRARMARVAELSEAEIQGLILDMPSASSPNAASWTTGGMSRGCGSQPPCGPG